MGLAMPMGELRNCVFKIGDYECWVLHDGSRAIGSMTSGSANRFIFGDTSEAELEICLRPYGGLNSSTVLPFNYLLVKSDGCFTLLDVGCGDQAKNEEHPDEPAGLLTRSLNEVGLSVEDIDTVIVSHWHWDHFGGAIADGEVAFPNAEYVMSMREADYIRAIVKGWALEYLNLIEDRMSLVEGVAEVGSGITVKNAPGHTPGIIVAEVSSGVETLLYTSDLILHRAHLEHIDWIPSFETERIVSAASRRWLIEEAYRRKLLLFVPHLSGALGRVAKGNIGYKWVDEPL